MRQLGLVALVACSSASGSAEPHLDGLDRWLDKWDRARACLVAGGSNTAEGVAIAMLTGPACARQLHALDESIPVDDRAPLQMEWRDAVLMTRALEREESVDDKAALVDRIDRQVAKLAKAIGRAAATPLRNEPLRLATVRAIPKAEPLRVDDRGNIWSSRLRWRVPPTVWGPPTGGGVALEADAHRVVLRTVHEDHAFDVFASTDRGEHWQRWSAPPNTRWINAWPTSADSFDVVFRDLDSLYLQHVTTAPPEQPIKLESMPRDAFDVACRSPEHLWVIDGDDLRHYWLHDGVTTRRLPSRDVGHISCRENEALIVQGEPEMLIRCDAECSPLVLGQRRPVEHGVGGFDNEGRWMYAATTDAVVAVWRQGRARPVTFRLPFAGRLSAITGGRHTDTLELSGPDGRYEVSFAE